MIQRIFSSVMFVTFFALSLPAYGAQQKVKRCSAAADAQVHASLSFLQANLEAIMARVPDLKDGEKRRLRDNVKEVDVKCMDDKAVCENHDSRGGITRHIFDLGIVICYNRIRDFGGVEGSCLLDEVILHEFAHTAGVNSKLGHNGGPNDDRVYRTGFAAADECIARGLASSIPENTFGQ